GITLIFRQERARHFVERVVDWWTLTFFMMLFAVAGTLEHVGLTARMAEVFTARFGHDTAGLIPVVLATTAVGSAFVDNVVFVAAFSPVIRSLSETVFAMPLWWALLFGACFGGNVTMIGSTANIVALGLLERHSHQRIGFWQWFKVGTASALVACLVAWGLLAALSPAMARYSAARAPAAEAPGR
ncbi:MAG: SLC13 family permease, partial [Kiritimatiellia bacterium]